MQSNLKHKTLANTVYRKFQEIPVHAYSDFYEFYHHYNSEIQLLDSKEYLEIKYKYILSLYHLDKYSQFYCLSDELIDELLNGNTFDAFSKERFEKVLWYKAEAFRNERKTNKAQYIYSELVKMNPTIKKYKRKLFYMLIAEAQLKSRKKMAFVVILISLSLICTGISLLIVNPFFSDHTALFIFGRNLLFLSGLGLFILLQSIHFKQAANKIHQIKSL
jgi:hypothetical protein